MTNQMGTAHKQPPMVLFCTMVHGPWAPLLARELGLIHGCLPRHLQRMLLRYSLQ